VYQTLPSGGGYVGKLGLRERRAVALPPTALIFTAAGAGL